MELKTNYLFILCGQAFSGKSTLSKRLAEEYGALIIGRDTVYFALEPTLALDETSEADDSYLWQSLWPLALQGVKNQLMLGKSVVFDDMCLYISERDQLRAIAESFGVTPVLIYLDTPFEVRKQRKAQNKITQTRHDMVPSSWLDEDVLTFEHPIEKENPIIYTEDVNIQNWLEQLSKKLLSNE